MVKVFSQTVARFDSGPAARRAEQQGWDGLSFVDSQNLSGDVYVALTSAAAATDSLLVGTGVTNPVTRHPVVTAGAIASVHAASGGRASLGIGRGDSALAHVGRAPARVRDFERYLRTVQAYLRGEWIDFDDLDYGEGIAPPVDELELAKTATASTIAWLPSKHDKVPVEVAATGPRVIGVGARLADRVMFALGADAQRISWGMQIAREAREAAGLDPTGVSYGAYVNTVCDDDVATARDLVRGGLSTFARFSVLHGNVIGPTSDEHARTMLALRSGYDMQSHTRADSAQAAGLPDSFVDAYAVVGPAEHCIERLQELVALGLDKLVVVGATLGAERGAAEETEERFAAQVIPGLRS